MSEKPPVLLLRLQAAYEGERQRVSLKRWMTDNYDGFCQKLDEMFPNQIDWIWLTNWFQQNGFRNRDGSDLKKETVRRIFRRVVDERSKVRPKRARQVQVVRETAERATEGRNDLFRMPVTAAATSPPVRVEQPVSPSWESGLKPRSVPQAPQSETDESETISLAERAMAKCLAEMDKRSGRG